MQKTAQRGASQFTLFIDKILIGSSNHEVLDIRSYWTLEGDDKFIHNWIRNFKGRDNLGNV